MNTPFFMFKKREQYWPIDSPIDKEERLKFEMIDQLNSDNPQNAEVFRQMLDTQKKQRSQSFEQQVPDEDTPRPVIELPRYKRRRGYYRR